MVLNTLGKMRNKGDKVIEKLPCLLDGKPILMEWTQAEEDELQKLKNSFHLKEEDLTQNKIVAKSTIVFKEQIRKETAKQIFDSIEDIFRMKMNSEGLDEGIWYNAETISMQNIDALKQKYGVGE